VDIETNASIAVAAPVERVWDALTTPELIRRWFFGVDTETTWQVGTPIVHRGEYQGEPYEDIGRIVAFEPPTLLVHTHWSDRSGVPDLPEKPRAEGTQLTVTERNLPSEEAKAISDQSWPMALEALREVVESSG
jgi:uncharacterized protein YndB with AHSA1/START domain